MRAYSSPVLLLALLALALGASAARASERSALLTAQGEVAYDAGQWDVARERFADALADDPSDGAARYGLGLALGKLGRWSEAKAAFEEVLAADPGFADAARARDIAAARLRDAGERAAAAEESEGAARRSWGLRAGTGMQYDSNVRLDPTHPKRSGAAVFTAGAYYEPVHRRNFLLRLDWDLYETVQTDARDFDFGWNSVFGTASWAPHPAVWLGLQGGYDHYTLGGDQWLQEPWVKPFANVIEGNVGVAYLAYRWGFGDWRAFPFHDVRTGPTDAVSLTQMFFLGDPSRWISFGWQWDDERPTHASGDDYRRYGNQGLVGLGLPGWWRTYGELTLLYRADDYLDPNSFSPTHQRRQDDQYEMIATIRRPITDWLSAIAWYDGTWHPSNIGLFDYRRHVVGAGVEVTY